VLDDGAKKAGLFILVKNDRRINVAEVWAMPEKWALVAHGMTKVVKGIKDADYVVLCASHDRIIKETKKCGWFTHRQTPFFYRVSPYAQKNQAMPDLDDLIIQAGDGDDYLL
jgi:hypothetical protein